jgi:hypothetical protein
MVCSNPFTAAFSNWASTRTLAGDEMTFAPVYAFFLQGGTSSCTVSRVTMY